MSARGKLWIERDGAGGVYFMCPGCDMPHVLRIRVAGGENPSWEFNGDFEKPTFSPSVLVTGSQRLTEDERARVMAGETIKHRPLRCHSFVTDGRIQFLSDCTHDLAGQTVDLPDAEGDL